MDGERKKELITKLCEYHNQATVDFISNEAQKNDKMNGYNFISIIISGYISSMLSFLEHLKEVADDEKIIHHLLNIIHIFENDLDVISEGRVYDLGDLEKEIH